MAEQMDSREMTKLVIEALEDKHAVNVKVIDISTVSVLADYFVIANGTNRSQIQAMSDAVEETLGKRGITTKQVEGYQSANWVLLDFGDVIVHLFDEKDRLLYALERIWRDGKQVDPETFEEVRASEEE